MKVDDRVRKLLKECNKKASDDIVQKFALSIKLLPDAKLRDNMVHHKDHHKNTDLQTPFVSTFYALAFIAILYVVFVIKNDYYKNNNDKGLIPEKLNFADNVLKTFGPNAAPSLLHLHRHLINDNSNAPAKIFVFTEHLNDLLLFNKQVSEVFKEFNPFVIDAVPEMSSVSLYKEFKDVTSKIEKPLIIINDFKGFAPSAIRRILDPNITPSKEAAIILTASGMSFPAKMDKKQCVNFVRKYLSGIWLSDNLSEEQSMVIITCLPASKSELRKQSDTKISTFGDQTVESFDSICKLNGCYCDCDFNKQPQEDYLFTWHSIGGTIIASLILIISCCTSIWWRKNKYSLPPLLSMAFLKPKIAGPTQQEKLPTQGSPGEFPTSEVSTDASPNETSAATESIIEPLKAMPPMTGTESNNTVAPPDPPQTSLPPLPPPFPNHLLPSKLQKPKVMSTPNFQTEPEKPPISRSRFPESTSPSQIVAPSQVTTLSPSNLTPRLPPPLSPKPKVLPKPGFAKLQPPENPPLSPPELPLSTRPSPPDVLPSNLLAQIRAGTQLKHVKSLPKSGSNIFDALIQSPAMKNYEKLLS